MRWLLVTYSRALIMLAWISKLINPDVVQELTATRALCLPLSLSLCTPVTGDCCESTCTASTYSCENYDDDTCLDPLAMYSSCDYDSVDKYYSEIGDSICDTDLNTRDCAWDGGESHSRLV